MTAPEQDPRRMIRKLNLVGLAITVLLVGGVGGWATTAQLAGAVIAPGTIVVESNVKKVQHPTGGVVGEILVKEGSEVDEGQVVLRLDDTVTKATTRGRAIAIRRADGTRGSPVRRTRRRPGCRVPCPIDEPAQ